ncbi:WecB/TagA/CpsF family glycosyltransferase [Flavimaricola marinus]|uniref:Putative N-acetylmannosaminyltransferase n=1 Tax=Flavimaricola marinus TaxID=1819565 RepID=A0A238LAX2_9RHOB|nr:WecB/TagA/CpsF family glycosyltransferase [Flavimaricola marinus]SMY06877.1 Putative N-acetylmannosaminyltransferase [Flavimaricola marinus]
MQFHTPTGQVSVTVPDAEHLWSEVGARLRRHEGFALATLNLDHLVKLRNDAAFAAAYASQDLITADGNPVVWLSRLGGKEVALLPGADLVIPLAKLAVREGRSVALLGTTDPNLSKSAEALQAIVPGLEVALKIAPPMGFDPEGDAALDMFAQLEAAGVGLCFLALGAPKQEQLAARGRRLAPSVGFVSIGAGLDFLAGSQVRAPAWMRRIAMEWLWRMLRNPRRLAVRYARCAVILPGHTWRAWRQN